MLIVEREIEIEEKQHELQKHQEHRQRFILIRMK